MITPEPGQPLVLPNGTVINPALDEHGRRVVHAEEVNAKKDVEDAIEDPFDNNGDTFQRTLADVNVQANEFNPVMLVLGYNMWGLDKFAIARFLDREVEVIESIMSSDLFTETRKQLLEAIRYAENSTIHGFLTEKAKKAATTVAAALQNPSADIKLAAAKDILDRAGFRPADRTEHVHRFEDELRIKYVTETPNSNIDTGV